MVFKRIRFAIQKGLAAQLVARLPSTTMVVFGNKQIGAFWSGKRQAVNVTFLILYVDDIIIMGNHILSLQSVKDYLGKCFAMKDLRKATFILGIKIYRDRLKRLTGLGQNAYMDKILKDLGEPANYKAALLDPESDKWLNAINVEMQSMKDNKVWDLVDLLPNGKIVGSKLLFKKKIDMDGAVHTFKARIVAKGFTQTYGVDYKETFSPVTMRFGKWMSKLPSSIDIS
nr:putative retrotransposon Ty1-copia subclass protein [Tanacetum cinerariifolium]